MYKILCLNKISPVGTKRFGEAYTFSPEMKEPDGILVRSAAMHDMELEENLLAIARAGAGVNNIPVDKCLEKGIVVFNTPGANANAVKELVLASLFLTSRKIVPAMDWVKTLKGQGDQVEKLIEKGKGQFAGPEIQGKTLGVVGLGAIGILVANAATQLGMEVYGYDPYLSVEHAWHLSSAVHRSLSLDEIYQKCDYITLHLPLTKDNRGMVNKDTLQKMKDGVRILNFARGGLVDSADLLAALESGKAAAYATDFPDDSMIGVEGIVAIPHLGASTPESEDNCAMMAVDQMKDYLENGNIAHSVNYPSCSMGKARAASRIACLHANVPNMIGQITAILAKDNANVQRMVNESAGENAYTMFDTDEHLESSTIDALKRISSMYRVRVIK